MLEFLIARNPDRNSSLPFLLAVPLPDGTCWFKAADRYPRATRVFCIPLACAPSPDDLEIVERVPAALACRRGNAIDLVLDRRMNRRSQFVTVSYRKRTSTFWQTAKAARNAKPGMRVPRNRSRGAPIYYVDTRERYAYGFKVHGAKVLHRALVVGDYAILEGEHILGVVERKTFQDFINSLQDGSLSLELMELAGVPLAAVVVEGTYSEVLRFPHARPDFLCDLIARLQVRYPTIPIHFLENRACAEEWTFRFLSEVHASGRSMMFNYGSQGG